MATYGSCSMRNHLRCTQFQSGGQVVQIWPTRYEGEVLDVNLLSMAVRWVPIKWPVEKGNIAFGRNDLDR